MDDNKIAAAFFIPKSPDQGDWRMRAPSAGISLFPLVDNPSSWDTDYDGLWLESEFQVSSSELSHHHLVELFLSQRSFYRLVVREEDKGPLPYQDVPQAVAQAFLRACGGLEAEAGLLVLNPHHANHAWICDHYASILAMTPEALVAERLGLLFLEFSLCRGWSRPANRKALPVHKGWLIGEGDWQDSTLPTRNPSFFGSTPIGKPLLLLEAPNGCLKATIDPNPRTVIGRSIMCDVPLLDASVARQHAVISFEAPNWYIEDAGSPSGTYVNEASIHRKTQLCSGDRIALGRHLLTVRMS